VHAISLLNRTERREEHGEATKRRTLNERRRQRGTQAAATEGAASIDVAVAVAVARRLKVSLDYVNFIFI